MRLDNLLLSPATSKMLVDGGVDRSVRGEVNASDHGGMDNTGRLNGGPAPNPVPHAPSKLWGRLSICCRLAIGPTGRDSPTNSGSG
jgi:hypothetical protein